MHPQCLAVGVSRLGAASVVAAMVAAVVMVSLEMNPSFQIGRVLDFLQRRSGRTYGPIDRQTYGRTDPLIEMRGRI